MMNSGKTILWSVLSVAVASVIPAAALAVPVVPNFTQETNDEPHRDDKYNNRNYKFNGLFDWISVFSDWFGRDSKR